jgi:hypothetical protein
VDIVEAIGPGPDSEVVAPWTIVLLAADVHSSTLTPRMKRSALGLPVYSYERWLRLRFTAPLVQAAVCRFWIENLDPNPGWSLRMGATTTYRKPLGGYPSDIAVQPVPTADPGPDHPNLLPALPSSTVSRDNDLNQVTTQYSPWLVLQARWEADNDDPFQDDPFVFKFAWDEG